MRQFIAPTEDFIKTFRTYLDGDFASGVDSINVDDNTPFSLNDWLLLGFEGSSQAELVRIIEDVVPGEALDITDTLFKHAADEPVQRFRYDQRKFYGCTTATGSFTELTSYGSPTNINVTDPAGTLFEYNGGEGYVYFKATYYNSTTDEETDIADSNAIGSDQTGRYCTIYDIRNQAGLTKNPYINDGVIETYRLGAESEIDSYIGSTYILPLLNSASVPEIPALINRCCVLLAAGFFDYKEFGADGQGVKWLGEARGILNKLQQPGMLKLLGSNKQPMQMYTSSSGVQSFPNRVDNRTGQGPERKFGMNQIF